MNKGLRHLSKLPCNSFFNRLWNWDLMNKGLRPWTTWCTTTTRTAAWIWIWDLMNKGLRRGWKHRSIYSRVTLSESETWWIRDWDIAHNPVIKYPIASSETETWWIRDWDLGMRRLTNLLIASETETWWIRDWDRVFADVAAMNFLDLKLRPDE